MYQYIIRRLLLIIPTFLGVTLVIFFIFNIIPGNPLSWMLETISVSPDVYNQVYNDLGLNLPLPERYFSFLWNLLRGNPGMSITWQMPVIDVIAQRIPYTFLLVAASMAMSLIFGVLLGVISALKRNSFIDYFVRTGTLVGVSLPSFWLGLAIILLFSYFVHLFPASGGGMISLIPASFTLGLAEMSIVIRLMRSSMLEVMAQDYIKTARGKGLSGTAVVFRHAIRNAAIPVITAWGLRLGHNMGGAVIVETVFSWPGIGKVAYDALISRDVLLVQGIAVYISLIVVIVNLIVDIAYTYLDPRIKFR